ncbi:MAPEG family protein [Maritalea sp. S77]|uniref:MAPEG family protein n=1 Tax=Maritalea sp. S77 TaxID=3415125 RepID=UPI003C7C713C
MSGFEKLLLLTVFAQVGLTLAVLLYLGKLRVPPVLAGDIKVADIALDDGNWPERSQQVSNNFNNQFQLPVLFYAAVMICFAVRYVPGIFLLCAVGFVASRYVHAYIHCTTNRVYRRFIAYVAGLAFLTIGWVDLVIELLIVL